MSEQNNEKTPEAGACGPGCSCGKSGGGSRMKWVICAVVALAAVATAAVHVSRTRAANGQSKSEEYAVSIPAAAGAAAARPVAGAEAEAWAVPLKALAELNVVATNTEGVFIVLPSNDDARTAAIQKEVSAAAATISARGTKMGWFVLSRDAQEYAALAQQVESPAVLAMCKGHGMSGVPDKQITQDGLLKAFVGASRPSGCGPGASGCGPGSSGCGPAASQPAGCN